MVSSIKWVDEVHNIFVELICRNIENDVSQYFYFQVVVGVPYFTALSILDENNCDFCVHGGKVYALFDFIILKL